MQNSALLKLDKRQGMMQYIEKYSLRIIKTINYVKIVKNA